MNLISRLFKREPTRLPVAIGLDRVVWVELPPNHTKAEERKLLAILKTIAEFDEEAAEPPTV